MGGRLRPPSADLARTFPSACVVYHEGRARLQPCRWAMRKLGALAPEGSDPIQTLYSPTSTDNPPLVPQVSPQLDSEEYKVHASSNPSRHNAMIHRSAFPRHVRFRHG